MSRIENTLPEAGVADVALLVLEAQLRAVVRALPLAARHAEEDTEHVHELRVASRRAVASMQVFRALIPRNGARRLGKLLRQIRKVAGRARDADMLLARWRWDEGASACIVIDAARQRRRAQGPLVAIEERLLHGHRLSRRIKKLLGRLTARAHAPKTLLLPRFGVWAREQLASRIGAFFEASRTACQSAAALHLFRISDKELSYAIEILAGAFPLELTGELLPVIEATQQKLGEITDNAVAVARLQTRLVRLASHGNAGPIARLLRSEETRLEKASRAFFDWWTPERSGTLHRSLLSLLPSPHK